MAESNAAWLEHFRTHGWVRIPRAFEPDAAAAMCAIIWEGLAPAGILRAAPSTWTQTRPEHLQHLKSNPIFRTIGTDRTIGAIRTVLEGQDLPLPKNWGAFFLHFPTGGEWEVPSSGWHMDGDYTGRLSPPCGVLIHAMLTDVGPRSGGTNILSGSHRLVHRWFVDHPPAKGSRSAHLRRSLAHHPYLRALSTPGSRAGRIERFHARVETVDEVPLRVLENTSDAGDVILMHSLLLHAVPAVHAGTQPRFLLSTSMQVPYW